MNLKSLSRLIQILDGNFPAGMFVHSFGLEPHIVKNQVTDVVSLKQYLKNLMLDQYLKYEWVCIKKVYQYLTNNNLKLLKKLDHTMGAYLTYEYAKASREIGQNYYPHLRDLVSHPIVKEYFKSIKNGIENDIANDPENNIITNHQAVANELVLLSSFAYDLGMDFQSFAVMWTKKNLFHIAMTALKISKITPSSIQQILFELDDTIFEQVSSIDMTTNDKMTNFNPLFEQIIFQHKHLTPKMFAT